MRKLRRALLARAVKTAPHTRRGRTPRPIPPDALERSYVAYARDVAAKCKAALERRLIPRLPALAAEADATLRPDAERVDAFTDELQAIINELLLELATNTSERSIAERAGELFANVDRYSTLQLGKQVQAIAGFDIPSVLPGGVELQKAFVRQNVDLIKSIPQKFFGEVQDRVSSGLLKGERPEQLTAEIQERYGVTEARAELIARDQTLKLSGQINKARQESLGLDKYVWRTVKDMRVRGRPDGKYPKAKHNHWAREGEVFSWSKPPAGGHPGEDFQCRCTAEPYLDDLLEE